MSRTNIFELVKLNKSIEKDGKRIIDLVCRQRIINTKRGTYSLIAFVNANCFHTWKSRGKCLDVNDFLETIGIRDGDLRNYKIVDVNDLLTLIEIGYNFWGLATRIPYASTRGIDYSSEVYFLKQLMDKCLSDFNQKAYYHSESEQIIVAEDSPQITAAAEASEPEIAWEIVRYNHRELAGDIAKKKTILKALGDELEGRKAEITTINSTLYNTITGALNNLNIRHNNVNPDNKSTYKQVVADMPAEELEQHYDDLYQLILLAIMEMDNVDRQRDMKQLIQSVNMKNER